MRLREYDEKKDFDEIKTWINDERRHAMWCANLLAFPLNKENFTKVLEDSKEQLGDQPYVAVTDEGETLGFFTYAVNPETNIGKYRFVIVGPKFRGQGYGKQMMQLAVCHAFDTSAADQVMLTVFPVNAPAKHCYEAAGFRDYETRHNYFPFKDETWDLTEMRIPRN